MVVGNTTIAGIGTTTKSNQDSRFADILGTGVKRTGKMITLDYEETETPWLQQISLQDLKVLLLSLYVSGKVVFLLIQLLMFGLMSTRWKIEIPRWRDPSEVS